MQLYSLGKDVPNVNLHVFFSSATQFGKLDESERRTEEYDTLVRHNALAHRHLTSNRAAVMTLTHFLHYTYFLQ